MNREDIIRMANKTYGYSPGKPWTEAVLVHLEKFASLVAAEEREACAKVCDEMSDKDGFEGGYAHSCAEAIRARSEK